MKPLRMLAAGLAALVLSGAQAALAADTNIAVAANFTEAAKEIAAAFKEKTGEAAILSFGSTGQLYTQISQGAPFEIFLAADDARPVKAVKEGYGVEGTEFTYAIGKIVLWSTDAGLIAGEETLKAGDFDKLAIANPQTAPYGAAAVEAMKAIGVYAALEPKIVQGNNIAQTFQFVQTGNAELGFVALSQIAGKSEGSRWEVPADLYTPIRQDAVLLKKGEESSGAKAFLDFLRGPEAGAIIEKYGYGTAAGS
ncbi:molybdate ABC transporter substrate-binding protein [Afifella sp. IM 167]|uniref:molybdate ABC transporter substrate-binding protein n=1 Tax=Afifella sp. IM 167 TaxID=2033586 RepID=UPI001CD033CD|nr:molybdate ABC transporter substrate-binding protein [Afifella sp. IM 167]MBZ8132874.1 molybdate ABC transporter substrate-binding protein [Afifella sp. IM 167]